MQGALGKMAMFAAVAAVLSACSPKEPSLMNFRSDGTGPDEFQILPTKPLEQPDNFRALPPPTPGAGNRTDPTPFADAAEALGGSGAAATSSPMRASERGVVAYASRHGVTAGIRETLAAEDLEWRRKHDGRVLERLFKTSVYFRAYRPMSLDQRAELERLRRLGVWTPSAPPASR
ncbi:MAG TPA: DUF3035 domain-containing protein [Rhodobacterales bacterium]|nr:DUF3035 domain-containing protein [Rhodobacterales bacterium]